MLNPCDHIRELFCAVLPLVLATLTSLAQDVEKSTRTVSSTDVAVKIDEHLSSLEPKGFSGVALLTVDGKEVLHRSYGLADRENNRRMTIDTGFDIGSIVKPMTKAAIVKLESEGKLSLEDKLSKHFEGVGADKSDVTLRHLVEHTSGLPDIFGDDYDIVTKDWVVQKALSSTLLFKPGEKNSYSNCGYSLLAAVIEKVSAKPYEQYMVDEILAPSGAKRIGYLLPKWKNEELAVGYREGKRWGTPLDHPWAPDGPSWNLRGNGGMLATVRELHTWFEAVYAGRVLDSKATQTYHRMTLRPRGAGGRGVGTAGGNGVFNSLHVTWYDAGVAFTCFTNVDEFEAEKVLSPLREIVDPLVASRVTKTAP